MPVFQLFLARNRAFHVAKHLKMNQPVNRVFRRMSGHCAVSVLPDAGEKIGCHANVERPVQLAGKDIDAWVFLFSHRRSFAEKWTLKQVQGDGI